MITGSKELIPDINTTLVLELVPDIFLEQLLLKS